MPMKWNFTPFGDWLSGCRISFIRTSRNSLIRLKKPHTRFYELRQAKASLFPKKEIVTFVLMLRGVTKHLRPSACCEEKSNPCNG